MWAVLIQANEGSLEINYRCFVFSPDALYRAASYKSRNMTGFSANGCRFFFFYPQLVSLRDSVCVRVNLLDGWMDR